VSIGGLRTPIILCPAESVFKASFCAIAGGIAVFFAEGSSSLAHIEHVDWLTMGVPGLGDETQAKPMTKPDNSLQERDAATWDEFYDEHASELYGFVFRLVRGDPSTAADVFQDTWLDAIGHIEQFDPDRGELRSWLFGIARRRVALHWRQRLARSSAEARSEIPRHALDGAVVPDDVVEHLEQAGMVQASLLAMPPERRQVLVEKYVEELSVTQIAARTGKSPKAVESLLSRAREQFRSLLRWYFSDSSSRNQT
jgi:RNA polymerase sigma-70 factor, ECF subfamily